MARMRRGVHQQLEDEANEILKRSLAGQKTTEERSDILTPAKENLRRRREVLVASGTPDPAIRQGIYHRKMNRTQTHLNSRDGHTAATRSQPVSTSADGLASFVERSLS